LLNDHQQVSSEKRDKMGEMQDRRIISLCLAILSLALIVGCLKWSVEALPGDDKDMQENLFPGEPPDDFFAGNYAIVGQKPADGAAYKGRAHIEIKDHKIRLSRTIDGRTTTVDGTFYPGGESKKKSLQFNWKETQGNAEMFCQYSVDFDNYARLSCVWSYGRNSLDGLPGFESYYSVAGLSKERRGKALRK
jgi:hypothetical protein